MSVSIPYTSCLKNSPFAFVAYFKQIITFSIFNVNICSSRESLMLLALLLALSSLYPQSLLQLAADFVKMVLVLLSYFST